MSKRKIIKSIKKETITIQDEKCWICDKKFNKEIYENRRTYHHAFPQRYKPKTNVKIPICQNCHNEINKEDAIYKRAYHTIRGMFLLTEKKIAKNLR